MFVYRLCKSKRANDLSGEGARRTGGRWNSKGVSMLYTAEHTSLALLEVSVHLSSLALKIPHTCITIEIPDDADLYQSLDPENLPKGWSEYPAPDILKDIGDQFALDNKYLALVVLSAIAPDERNYLFNPHHPRFSEVKIVKAEPFRIDPRIKQEN